jgi:putative ribosome biogenesis GTPase RsgA
MLHGVLIVHITAREISFNHLRRKPMTVQFNDHLVLLCGKSATGKSASLMNLEKPEVVMYLNCEEG